MTRSTSVARIVIARVRSPCRRREFLNEIGIAAAGTIDRRDGGGVPRHPERARRNRNRILDGNRIEEVESLEGPAFGVRSRRAQDARAPRQARTEERDGRAATGAAMHRADEPQQLQPSTLLDLVDREHEKPIVIEELLRERLEQIFEGIARAALGIRVGLGGRDCEQSRGGRELVRDRREPFFERAQRRYGAVWERRRAVGGLPKTALQRLAEAQRRVGLREEHDAVEGLGATLDGPQQRRLAHASQAGVDDRFRRLPGTAHRERRVGRPELGGPAGELGRLASRSGPIGVISGVHPVHDTGCVNYDKYPAIPRAEIDRLIAGESTRSAGGSSVPIELRRARPGPSRTPMVKR